MGLNAEDLAALGLAGLHITDRPGSIRSCGGAEWLDDTLQGILVPDSDPARFRFSVNHVFSSSSIAAGIIKDGNASGPSLWNEEKSGQTLKDYLARH